MTTFYTSDTHYWHRNIILPTYCNRPFASVEEMNEAMIRLWNERVGADDLVYHLGDFGFGPKEELAKIVARLNGTKILVKGNHDKSKATTKAMGFADVVEDWQISQTDDEPLLYLRHKPNFDYLDTVKAVFDGPAIHLCGHVHEKWARQGDIINVGVDQSWFMPLTLQELLTRD